MKAAMRLRRKITLAALLLISTAALMAHPMGNFSVSHYSKLRLTEGGVELEYVLDLAEIPTFELLRGWQLERNSPQAELESRAATQAREWLRGVEISADGKPLVANLNSTRLVIADGAGNLPIIRITSRAHVNAQGGKLRYEDHNFPDRAGWKEIVIESSPGAILRTASQSNADLSKGLTQYPPDPTLAPPQDLRAQAEWSIRSPVVAARKPIAMHAGSSPVIAKIIQPRLTPVAPAPATMTAKASPLGTVTRGDFLSKLLHNKELTPWMILLAIACAFALGAGHALTPGHGKTIVAAYLVGSRGTLKHAAFLGAAVTLTHTITVFALGLATLFLFRFIVPEKITVALGALSGLSIVVVGGWMLYKRISASSHAHTHVHDHHHHEHEHHDHHDHPHVDDHHHPHEHRHHEHKHHGHSHVPEQMSWAGLAALGASGGLVPCESALVLLLGAVALGRIGLGLVLLVAFSLGLALVLMMIGVLVLYAKDLLPEHKRTGSSPFFRWMSIASPAIVMVVGLVMTGVSLGWIQPSWMIN